MALLFVFRISYFLFLILPYFIPPVLLQRLPCIVRRPVSYTHLDLYKRQVVFDLETVAEAGSFEFRVALDDGKLFRKGDELGRVVEAVAEVVGQVQMCIRDRCWDPSSSMMSFAFGQ